jgi:glycosyltransferase 2 family protein
MGGRKRWIVGIGLLVSAIFLYIAFRELRPDEFFASLQGVNVVLLLVGAVVYFGAVAVISLRWQFLLRPVQVIALFPLMQIVSIGYMGNNVYPLRAGEALRVFLLRRNHQMPVARATTTVIVERVFDGLVMLAFIFIALLMVDIQEANVDNVVKIAAPIFLFAIIVFFVLAAVPNLLRRLVRLFIAILPQSLSITRKLHDIAEHLTEDIINGLEALRSPVNLAGAVICSFVSWGIEAAVYWIVMQAFGLNLPYAAALLVVGTVNLAGLIPAAPGNLGVYEFFATAVLMAMAVDRDTALAYALVVHIVIWLPVTLAGFYFLARMGLGWSTVTHAQELEEQAAET